MSTKQDALALRGEASSAPVAVLGRRLGWDFIRTCEAVEALIALLTVVVDTPPPPQFGGGIEPPRDGEDGEADGDRQPTPGWKPFQRARVLRWGPPGTIRRDDPTNWEPDGAWVPPTRASRRYERPWTDARTIDWIFSTQDVTNTWMRMDVEVPHLKRPKWAKGVGVTDTGSVFRAPWRLTSDQRVFRMNRAKRQGSLLIDASGSMRMGREDVEQIVRSVPAAVIAMYSGGNEGYRGAVRVLAKWGRLATTEAAFEPTGGCNGVDGPALRWLAHQPAPRIWISDGGVTGIHDRAAPNLYREVEPLCQKYRIVRVASLAAAMRLI